MRKPTVTDIEKLYRHHEEKHVFSGMLGKLDCTYWEWFGCPYAFKGQYVTHDHGSNPFICYKLLCRKIYGYDMLSLVLLGRTTTPIVSYPSGYYLIDGIYPELAPLVKTIPEPAHDDYKQIFYKQKKESAKKDVEREFGVLKKKWAVLANPT
ncbi:ALP1-like protein [Tanacetum coccineum]